MEKGWVGVGLSEDTNPCLAALWILLLLRAYKSTHTHALLSLTELIIVPSTLNLFILLLIQFYLLLYIKDTLICSNNIHLSS